MFWFSWKFWKIREFHIKSRFWLLQKTEDLTTQDLCSWKKIISWSELMASLKLVPILFYHSPHYALLYSSWPMIHTSTSFYVLIDIQICGLFLSDQVHSVSFNLQTIPNDPGLEDLVSLTCPVHGKDHLKSNWHSSCDAHHWKNLPSFL